MASKAVPEPDPRSRSCPRLARPSHVRGPTGLTALAEELSRAQSCASARAERLLKAPRLHGGPGWRLAGQDLKERSLSHASGETSGVKFGLSELRAKIHDIHVLGN